MFSSSGRRQRPALPERKNAHQVRAEKVRRLNAPLQQGDLVAQAARRRAVQRPRRAVRLSARQVAFIERRGDPDHGHPTRIQQIFGPLPVVAGRFRDVLVPDLPQLRPAHAVFGHDIQGMAHIGINFIGNHGQLHRFPASQISIRKKNRIILTETAGFVNKGTSG